MAIVRLLHCRPAALRPATLRTSLLQPTRTFASSPLRRLKEDVKNPSPEEAERVKQEQLKKQERGEGHWHEELASSGEAAVKADQEQPGDHDEHIEDLQEQTKDQADKGKI